MEREANYVAVGAFVLLVAVMAALFVYWYSDARDQHDYTRYEIYFDGSVSGLSEGGQVRYLGVDVGRVVRIRLDRRAADRVQVIADIDSSAPISDRTLAELSLQGVTGLLYIDLQQLRGGTQNQPVMALVQSENYPVIRSVHSNFDLFLSSLPELAVRAGELATRANRLLSDENIAALTRLAASVERAGSALPQAARDAGALIAELRSATAESREVIAQVRAASATAAPDLAAGMARLRVTADHLATASEQLDGILAENRSALRGFMQQGLPQVEALVRDSRDAAHEFQQLSRSLRENPSRLLYQPASSGVEIPR
ncbi:MAG TPA: MlaD family protein [Steroidobacteraceae bacterium]|nr:MlaD family protein [Steroidobacteraceae bacterium]